MTSAQEKTYDQSWLIEDLEILVLLKQNDFSFTRHWPTDWYVLQPSLPIPLNGTYTLPSGHTLRAHGTELLLMGSQAEKNYEEEKAKWEKERLARIADQQEEEEQ